MAKLTNDNPAGVYLLRGVMEMASGFNLAADHSFEFFFSYGALDRYGKGTWQQEGDTIIFNSEVHPGKDFKLIASRKTSDPSITLRFDLKNPVLYNYIYAYTELPANGYPTRANNDGCIKLLPVKDTITLLFEFVPERASVFEVDTKQFNEFSFDLEPWLTDVYFSGSSLTLENNKLLGAHPLITKPDCEYHKE